MVSLQIILKISKREKLKTVKVVISFKNSKKWQVALQREVQRITTSMQPRTEIVHNAPLNTIIPEQRDATERQE